MKTKLLVAIILLALTGALAVPSVWAGDDTQEKPVSKRALKKYDADKDGQLSPEEKAVMDGDKAKKKAERKAKKEAEKAAKEAKQM